MKKTPLRMCMCCREMLDKKDLYRVVKTPDERIMLDLSGKMNGRGAYICSKKDCLDRMKKQRIFNRAFKLDVSDDVYDKIKEAVESESYKN